jgi:hypothetical protein
MTAIKYAHLMKLTHNELHKKLVERNLPQATIQYIEQIVADQKETSRTKKIKQAAHAKLWDALLKPLRKEIRSTRGSLTYKDGHNDDDQERRAAFAYYETVLLKIQRKLTDIKRTLDATPSEAALEASIPNKGEHWSDWIPTHIKSKTVALFDAIPHKLRAKRKIPFERNIPIETQESRLMHKRSIIEGRLEGLEQVLLIYKDDARYERMGHMPDTQDKIDDAKSKIRDIDRQLAELKKC